MAVERVFWLGQPMSETLPRYRHLRRFHFNLPQRVAAGLFLCFALQVGWRVLYRNPQPFSYASLLHWFPSLLCGLALAQAIWWVTRRLFGNLAGYTALAFYSFSSVSAFAARPTAALLGALMLYGGFYTTLGISHALQGPRRKWKPRIVLLAVLYSVALFAYPPALSGMLLLGVPMTFWLAKGMRKTLIPVLALSLLSGYLGAFFLCGASWSRFQSLLTAQFSLHCTPWDAHWRQPGIAEVIPTLLFLIAGIIFLCWKRPRFFGCFAPLLCALVVWGLAPANYAMLLALPFGLTFIAGVMADAYDSRWRWWAFGAVSLLLSGQIFLCYFDFYLHFLKGH